MPAWSRRSSAEAPAPHDAKPPHGTPWTTHTTSLLLSHPTMASYQPAQSSPAFLCALLSFIGVCYLQESFSEHSSNWSQVIQLLPACQAAECWPQVTLLTPSKATPSTPAPCQIIISGQHRCIHQVKYPLLPKMQLLNSLCAWYWSFEPRWSWQTWGVPKETKYDQMKQKHIKMSPFGSIPINLQAHHYPRPCECLQLRTAAPFAPPLLGLSWVTTINLGFARQCNDNK